MPMKDITAHMQSDQISLIVSLSYLTNRAGEEEGAFEGVRNGFVPAQQYIAAEYLVDLINLGNNLIWQ